MYNVQYMHHEHNIQTNRQYSDVAEAKRVCRHQQPNPPPPTRHQGSACKVCGHACASAIRLRSHTCRHKGMQWAASLSIEQTKN